MSGACVDEPPLQHELVLARGAVHQEPLALADPLLLTRLYQRFCRLMIAVAALLLAAADTSSVKRDARTCLPRANK